MYSIQKRHLIKQKLEIAAIITHGEIFPILFLKLSWLENMFENTRSWVIPDIYIKKKHINSFTSTLLTNAEPMLYFWTPLEGFFFQGVKNTTLDQFGLRSYLIL